MRPGSVAVAYCHPGEVSHSFHQSIRGMVLHDITHHRRLVGFIAEECGTQRVTDGRNSAVKRFLATDAEWLAFIDADMGFEPDAIDRLIDQADPKDRPIVGGLAFGQRKGPDTIAGARRMLPVPTIYRWIENDQTAGVAPVYDYPQDQLVECDATGAAFFVAHRLVFEKLAAKFGGPRPWFDEAYYKGQIFSEDLTFFRRAAEHGLRLYVDTSVKTSHLKHVYYEEALLGDLTDLPTYVVVPAKNRLDLTRRCIDSLDGYDRLFLIDNGSNRKTKNWLSTLDREDVEVIHMDDADLHQMWNRGLDEASKLAWPCNVAIVNNDIEAEPGMLPKLAEALRGDPLMSVVSPNYDGREGEGLVEVDSTCGGRYDGTGGIAGFCFMLKAESGYRFPDELGWWYGDSDMMAAALSQGNKAAIVLDAACVHVDGGSQTGDWDSPEWKAQIEQDRKTFMARWGLEDKQTA